MILTINAIKEEGRDSVTGEYTFYSSAYIEEFPMIVLQTFNWDENELKENAREMYNFVIDDEHFRKDFPAAPQNIDDFNIIWFTDLDEWLNADKK